MPVSLENRHTMIIGKPGTGKTQAMRPIIKRLYERENQVIQYDNKGEYFAEFFNPKTDLLNLTLSHLETGSQGKILEHKEPKALWTVEVQ